MPVFEDQIEGLKNAQDELAAQEKALQDQVAELRTRRQAIDRAIKALSQAEGDKPKPKKKPQKKKDWTKDWIPSEKILNAVLEALRANGEMSVPAAAKAAGSSPETTRRALNVLRERELVRLSATRGPQNNAIYAPMPNNGSH